MFSTNLFPKIVGSSRGLGRELAFKLAALDATVICIDLQKSDQEMTSKTVTDLGGTAYYYQCDVTSKEQVEKTMNEIMTDIGKVTMLYTCCSLPSPRSVLTNPPSVRQTIDTSVTSYFYVSVASVFYQVLDFHHRPLISAYFTSETETLSVTQIRIRLIID